MRDRKATWRSQSDRGAAAVEFALILPVLILLIFGIIQYGSYFFAAQNGSSVLRELARKVAVGDCVTQTQMDSYVANRLSAFATTTPVVTRTYSPDLGGPPNQAVGDKIILTIQFDSFDLNFPFIPVPGDGTVGRRVETRVEDTTSGGC